MWKMGLHGAFSGMMNYSYRKKLLGVMFENFQASTFAYREGALGFRMLGFPTLCIV